MPSLLTGKEVVEYNESMNITDKFIKNNNLTKEEFTELIRLAEADAEIRRGLTEEAVKLRRKYYGIDVYTRGNWPWEAAICRMYTRPGRASIQRSLFLQVRPWI